MLLYLKKIFKLQIGTFSAQDVSALECEETVRSWLGSGYRAAALLETHR